MRPFATFLLLGIFVMTAGQTRQSKKISLAEAVSVAFLRNAALKTESEKKVVKNEVEKAYFDLIYQINRYDILKRQVDLFHDLERVANLKYAAGDIDLLEKTAMISRLAEIKTSQTMMLDELAISGNQLKNLLFTTDDMIPADSALSMYIIQKEDDLFPESDSDMMINRMDKKENLELELNGYFKQLQYFNRVALVHADLILETSRIRLEKEDIDYVEFTKISDEAFRIKLEYLMTLNKYNRTAIELEHYAY